MKKLLGMKLSGMTLVECLVAMVILFGILTLMFVGFSVSGDYIVKGMSMQAAAQEAMDVTELASIDVADGKDVSGYSNLTVKDGTVTLHIAGSTEVIDGKYYTAGVKADGITSEKTMYYTTFAKNSLNTPVTPPAPTSKVSLSEYSISAGMGSGYYRLEIQYDGENIPPNKKNSIYIVEKSDSSESIIAVRTATKNGKAYININPKGKGTATFKLKYNGDESQTVTVTIT